MAKILIYDSFEKTRNNLLSILESSHELSCAASEDEFQDRLKECQFDLVLLDVDSYGRPSLGLVEQIRQGDPYLPIIMTAKSENAEVIVQAMNSGVSDFLVHPISSSTITIAVEKAIEIRDQRFEIAYHRRNQDVVYDFDEVVAVSANMQRVLKTLGRFAKTDSTVLITGETGTGKSFLSGSVHFNSPRRKKPFVIINCGNIPEILLESELFGHVKDAFPGADQQRIGRLEQANGGTIFLDEIGAMSPGLQTKLLRMLTDGSFEPVGGTKTIYSDVRIIAATSRDLVAQVEQELFREDLYYRLNVLPVSLPSLEQRRDCLMPLAELLLQKCCSSMHREIRGFSENAGLKIEGYEWPGNIRQLANTIEGAVILEDTDLIHSINLVLPDKNRDGTTPKPAVRRPRRGKKRTPPKSLVEQEKELILQELEACLWVQKNAAKKLGISPRTLNYKIAKFGITHHHWRRNKAVK